MKNLLLSIFLTLCFFNCRNTNTTFLQEFDYSVKVTSVTDGDTFKGLTANNQQITYRIYGIDAPEKSQDYGDRSKQFLYEMIFGKTVNINPHCTPSRRK